MFAPSKPGRRGQLRHPGGAGRGHYVGCNLNIDCFERQQNDWYGEGDDMIFIDGELPTLRGTGTEDYFNTAFSPHDRVLRAVPRTAADSGTEEWPWSGKNSMYRWHIEDPVHFRESISVTIEHGHANHLSNDYSSDGVLVPDGAARRGAVAAAGDAEVAEGVRERSGDSVQLSAAAASNGA